MINPLIDEMPDFVEIKGKKYRINTDFKTWMKIYGLIREVKESSGAIVKILKLCYIELPQSLEDAMKGVLFFLCGDEEKDTGKENHSLKAPVFSFFEDAQYIYAAFYVSYKINLLTEKIHWWQFLALFKALPSDTEFLKIVSYRGVDLSKIKDKEQKRFYQKMKRTYALKDTRSEKEKEDAIANALSSFFRE